MNAALVHLHDVYKQQLTHSEGVHVVVGDFNRACLKTVFPSYTQYVNCATKGNNTLDRVYSNLKHVYRSVPLPHLDLSDHLSLGLLPTSSGGNRLG